jgi:hypothetical protein
MTMAKIAMATMISSSVNARAKGGRRSAQRQLFRGEWFPPFAL